MFENIPIEMRSYRQWVVWRYEETEGGKQTKVPYSPLSGNHANVNDPNTWATYEDSLGVLKTGWYSGIGFVLTDDDPYGFIDLDEPKNPDGTPLEPTEFAQRFERQKLIYETFNSYAELSPSGSGLHIIVKGKIESGRKRSSIEVYSGQRFMTMTGNLYRPSDIKDYSVQLNSLWEELGKGRDAALFYAGLEKAALTDEEVLNIANGAINAEKFHDLYVTGNWQKYNYPSQSEADFALMDIIAYYSKNAAQTQRIFLRSKLAEREKSRAQYRLNYMLARCFDRMLPPIDFEGLKNNINAAIDRKIKEQAEAEKIDRTVTQVPGNAIYIEEEKAYLNLPPPVELPDNTDAIYSVPEGLVGQIAQFIYAQAPLPVPEIALAGAIGLMSGIVGKAYNISNTGCNQYTLLISPTGSGKEAIASGLSKIMRAVKKIVPNSNEFIGPAEISSPQALIKVLADTPSIYSVVGEFGLALKAMSAENAAPAQMGLRRMLLDIYNKSGAENEVQRTVYSDKDKNTQAVRAPSFSLIGESTPERFYAYLSEEMISEGLLPRFNIIENMSPPAEFNEGAALVKPSEQLVRSVATLAANALNLIRQNQVINVQETDEASIILKNFRDLARHKTIQAVEDARKHLWNRAHVKALKLAAVVAIGNNFFNPVITATDAQWAIKIVQRGVEVLLARFESGDVGLSTDENKQLACIGDKIKAYLLSPYSKLEKVIGKGYGEAAITLHSERIIPYSYLQHSCSCMKVFKSDKLGATTAIKRALKTLVERGDISEVPRAELSKITKSKSICYMVELPKSFGL